MPAWGPPYSRFANGRRGPSVDGFPGVINAEFEEVGMGHDGVYSRRREEPLRDPREYPLGFYQAGIPGSGPVLVSKDVAKKLAQEVANKLVESMTTGKVYDFRSAAEKLLSHGGVGAIDVIPRPQIVFRGERLTLSEHVAKWFAIIDIKVGNRSQLANSTAIPGSAFVPSARPMKLALDTATVAMDIAIVVENMSRRARTFKAVLSGSAAQ